MMESEPDPNMLEVRFDDEVNVNGFMHGRQSRRGIKFGDWYVAEGVQIINEQGKTENPDSYPAGSRFSVGHNPTGRALVWGLEFWDAKRIALALADADPDTTSWSWEEVEALIGSALMDHYVFPISGWSV